MIETSPTSNRTGPALVTTGVGPDLLAAAREATRLAVIEAHPDVPDAAAARIDHGSPDQIRTIVARGDDLIGAA